MSIIARGAEAIIRKGTWHSRPVVIKERVPKSYRVPALDRRLRSARTKSEAQLMCMARDAGIVTPVIFDIDIVKCVITMELVEGIVAKEALQHDLDRLSLARIIGDRIARLHRADIIHGDLTTSNMIFRGQEPCFIDFGLGEKSAEPEKKGVDLHLLKEALSSAHSEYEGLFDSVVEGYLGAYPEGEVVITVMKDIESRGRYN